MTLNVAKQINNKFEVHMKMIALHFLLLSSSIFAEIPNWVNGGKLKVGNENFIVCSGDASSPEMAKRISQKNCLIEAMKLSNIGTILSEKYEADMNENKYNSTYGFDEQYGQIKCKFINQYLENHDGIFRYWHQCVIKDKNIERYEPKLVNGEVQYGPKKLFEKIEKLESDLEEEKNKSKFSIEENRKFKRINPNKVVKNNLYLGMPISKLKVALGDKYLKYISSDMLCKNKFNTDDSFSYFNLRICASSINGIVLGYCSIKNECFELE